MDLSLDRNDDVVDRPSLISIDPFRRQDFGILPSGPGRTLLATWCNVLIRDAQHRGHYLITRQSKLLKHEQNGRDPASPFRPPHECRIATFFSRRQSWSVYTLVAVCERGGGLPLGANPHIVGHVEGGVPCP